MEEEAIDEAAILTELLADERIASAAFKNGVLEFATRVLEAELSGHTIGIGRFSVCLGMHLPDTFTAVYTEKGGKGHQMYVLSNYGFCFGDRHAYIRHMVLSGEYLGAAYCMLETMASVNDGDVEQALKQYMHMPGCKPCMSMPGLPPPASDAGGSHG